MGTLYGLISTVTGGIEALQNATTVLSSKETRFLLGVYCQNRSNGMTPSEAWADVTIPEFQPLWDLINNLQSISLDVRQWNFEHSYISYRVAAPDSYNLRTNIGNNIVALCYPSIISQDTVGVLKFLTLYGSGNIGGTVPHTWEWDFEYDGNPEHFEIQATGKQASRTYRTTGRKTVGLRVTADGFAPIIVRRSILVLPPQIYVSYPNGYEGKDRHFSTPELPSVNEYTWNYGDTTPGESGRTNDHTYADVGFYTVGLTLTLDDNSTIQTEAGIFVGPGTRYIHGHTIYGEETWYSGGKYLVQGSIVVAQGGRLTIEPGTEVKLSSGSNLNISGVLTATEVTFTWANEGNEWGGIIFHGEESSSSKLKNCINGVSTSLKLMYRSHHGRAETSPRWRRRLSENFARV